MGDQKVWLVRIGFSRELLQGVIGQRGLVCQQNRLLRYTLGNRIYSKAFVGPEKVLASKLLSIDMVANTAGARIEILRKIAPSSFIQLLAVGLFFFDRDLCDC